MGRVTLAETPHEGFVVRQIHDALDIGEAERALTYIIVLIERVVDLNLGRDEVIVAWEVKDWIGVLLTIHTVTW